MLEAVKSMVFPKRNDCENASHHIKEKRSEVTDEGDDDQALRDSSGQIMSKYAETVPGILG